MLLEEQVIELQRKIDEMQNLIRQLNYDLGRADIMRTFDG